MNTSEKDKTPESNNETGNGGTWQIKLWGVFYFILGITGLAFSIYSLYYDIGNIVPLFGTVIASVLIGALSILILIYGYRVIKRDI